MYDLLKNKIKNKISDEDKINTIREFLQLVILKTLFDRGYFENIAFVGGTALRILYDLHRYSEDLDFSLINRRGYNFDDLINDISRDLEDNGFKIKTNSKTKNIVNSCFVKFPSLLYDLGLNVHKDKILSIKLEIDTNSPKGFVTSMSTITDSFFFVVKTFDISSLCSTKLHACFFRRYTKGRDFYDLLWYLGRKVKPNYLLLNNAIKQTEKKDLKIDSENIKDFIKHKLENIDFKVVVKDVEPFIEDKKELKMLDKKILMQLVDGAEF